MKRKINRVGTNTLTVSLPAKWVQQNEVKQGDEIELEESLGSLILYKEFKPKGKSIKLDLTNLESKHMRSAIQISYKEGYDEIRVNFANPEVIPIIEQEVNYCPGLEIIKQTDRTCIIKNIAINLKDELDNAMRRNFLNSLYMVESCIKKIKKGKLSELNELIKFEKINNKLCSLCERMVNVNKSLREKTVFFYVVVWHLENVVDDFKFICEFFSKKENMNTKISKDTIHMFEEVYKIFRMFYELYYSYDMKKQLKVMKLNEERRQRAYDLLSFKKGKELVMLSLLDRAADRIIEMIPSTFALHSQLFEIKN